MDFAVLVDPILKGVVAGFFISTLGLLKNNTANADPNSDPIAKLFSANVKIDWGHYFSTVFITCVLSIAAFLLIYFGVPTEVLLALVPLAMRESLNDALSLANNMRGNSSSK